MQQNQKDNTIHILNPAAGKGKAMSSSSRIIANYATANECTKYVTKSIGDAETFVRNCCVRNPFLHFVVHGGDGTVNEVANGIIKAGAAGTASFSVIPYGTGNDFIRNFGHKEETHKIDVIKYNERFAVNMINIGFDCSVAYETSKLKGLPFISGSMAYILGIFKVFFKKMGRKMEISFTDENNTTHIVNDDILLCAISNGSYCGGGFKSSPKSSVSDGLMEILIVRKLPRYKFVMMVNKYRSGTHIDNDTSLPICKLSKYMTYKKCRKVTIKNIEHLCVDGEVENTNSFIAEIIPTAITYAS